MTTFCLFQSSVFEKFHWSRIVLVLYGYGYTSTGGEYRTYPLLWIRVQYHGSPYLAKPMRNMA